MHKLILLLIAVLFLRPTLQAQGYHITVQIKPLKEGRLFLGHYMGKGTYLADSAQIGPDGTAVFQGKEALLGGIYLVVMPDKRSFFEMLVDKQQTFSVSSDTSDLTGKAAYKNSPDNELFLGYNHFLASEAVEGNAIQAARASARTAADTAAVRTRQQAFSKKIQAYREDLVAKHPQSLLASIFRVMQEVVVPPTPPGEDSTFPYRYTRAHFFDGTDFSDGRLVRTPVLENKLQQYFATLVPGYPDSINAACDEVIAKTRKDKEMFKFVLWWLTYNYESSQYMGMDAVFVYLVEKYYVPGDAYWLTDEQLNKIVARAYAIAPNLIGQRAAPLELKTTDNKPVSLYTTKSKFTVLVFWDPTCGHCKIEVPRLDSAYRASWQKMGVTMFGVKTDGTLDQWKEFLQTNKISPAWVQAYDPENKTNYHHLYDVYSTPLVYLLDENKKILAKRLGVEQLDDFIKHSAANK
ncbi:Thiol-disulfide isomerase or thioredoxin [Chitinophaga costaii]|uniref:Thiol-disulfide isomerase or thioredoxin n=1 Tax=Chitinophaga costaii TaxID=1335309 RepID=A0A1C4AB18_9BACT|nr:TlpA family protein disulfide reductase [Chitinophaga costaii]PUZ26532.1 DUF5106 domain-containing protein [Chitinophaga costaii]SCB91776.1 Thiol-disulfide isomerase or thioredoxin [Chitinophaga costaii]